MTLEELKEAVRQWISNARTDKAIDIIIQWAKDNDKDQLRNDASLIRGNLAELIRERMLGIISNSESTVRQSNIANSALELLKNAGENSDLTHEIIDNVETPHNDTTSDTKPLKILMLTANPANTTRLNLNDEHSAITKKLQKKQDVFNIIYEKAVSASEFQEYTYMEKPYILHFSGHGVEGRYAGIVVQNEDKNEEDLISVNGLEALFEYFNIYFKIKVVLLNACHTQVQAATISKHVDYVIGTNVAIGDIAARAFSSGFYFHLAVDDEMSIENAFISGRTAAVVSGAEKKNFVLYRHGKLIEVIQSNNPF